MIMLAMLGFTNFSRSLPLNDKLLHFMCFCLATGVFYFIFDVEEYVIVLIFLFASCGDNRVDCTEMRVEYGFGGIQGLYLQRSFAFSLEVLSVK